MQIYQAQPHEIKPLMQRGRLAWPHMAKAIDKAEQLLLTHAISATEDHFIVDSQANPAYTYRVRTDQAYRSCGCPSYATGSYVANGRKFCKHLMAVGAYIEILRDHLRPRNAGESANRAVRHKLQANRYAYLMRISGTTTITNIAIPRVYVRTTWGKGNKMAFATNHDAIVFARWLYEAEPLPADEIDRYDQEIARQQAAAEWQVNLTPEQLKRWYDTGSVV